MTSEVPAGADWAQVAESLRTMMKTRDMSIASLARKSGVSETTIRYIGQPRKRLKSTLVALAAGLGCYPDYLVKKATGEVAENRMSMSPGTRQGMRHFLEALQDLQARTDHLASSLDTFLTDSLEEEKGDTSSPVPDTS